MYCHAREAGARAEALWEAHGRAPAGAPVRMAVFKLTGTCGAFLRRLKRIRPAAACVFRVPLRDGRYSHRALLVLGPASKPEAADGVGRVRAVTGYCDVAWAAAYAFRMPRSWRRTAQWPRVEAGCDGMRLWEPFGLARADDAGAGWFSF